MSEPIETREGKYQPGGVGGYGTVSEVPYAFLWRGYYTAAQLRAVADRVEQLGVWSAGGAPRRADGGFDVDALIDDILGGE